MLGGWGIHNFMQIRHGSMLFDPFLLKHFGFRFLRDGFLFRGSLCELWIVLSGFIFIFIVAELIRVSSDRAATTRSSRCLLRASKRARGQTGNATVDAICLSVS
jgi:hypothetical protein